jgi:hypothetical protein
MRHLGGFEFLPDYIQPGGLYRGPAARIGTGSQVIEINAKAALHNITLLGGTCATVATYGGWTAGGGHGTLSSKYGLGSDQILSLQVVTADGEVVTADPETNPDLFFALRGGGPGKPHSPSPRRPNPRTNIPQARTALSPLSSSEHILPSP